MSGGATLSLLTKTKSEAARSGGNAVGRSVFLWRMGRGGCRASVFSLCRKSSSGGSPVVRNSPGRIGWQPMTASAGDGPPSSCTADRMPRRTKGRCDNQSGPAALACNASLSRRLDPDKLRTAEKEFRALEKAGIVHRSNSGWSSPLHMVPKADGSFRPCGDYRRLNTVTEDDQYPLPSIQDLTANLARCTVFSKIDLVKGYHQVPMAESDIPKTAICTPFGLFEYIFMPFGLKNAAQTFQRLMDKLFRHLPFVFVYLDDILIASKDLSEHMRHLRLVFEILQRAGLQINPAKCTFSVSSLTFFGHNVNSSGISPMEKHVKALTDFPPPSDLKHLQRFLGLINFNRRFLPGIAGTLQPLTDLLRGNPKTLVWSENAAAAFGAAKAALADATSLVHPLPGAVISLATDASDTHISGVLQQLSAGSWRPLAFFSRKLSPTESKYSTFHRELLAVFATIRHFRFVLEGRPFRILTDHLPLTLAMRRVSPLWSARQVRQLAYVSEFSIWVSKKRRI